ncbi:DUF4091 domain-containing protein [Persicirhabdus sediminis]|uniref:DUF4091 domain-containing protein n=1 Tax=Persicirhabdus sediminis TaxID=454144 RepID=A0A8J7MCD8_9BACT|nr:DUF4091 domain-containing protein [Persicirhabdus sediminis]MBK1790003.1 DUF4091 domain-containing protein [Persicirhabdus sediminis]
MKLRKIHHQWLPALALLIFASPLALEAKPLREPKAIDEIKLTEEVKKVAFAGAVGSIDERYARDSFPQLENELNWSASAWRGERVHGQFVTWTGRGQRDVVLSATDLKNANGDIIPAESVTPSYVRYTMAAGALYGDILEPNKPIRIPAGTSRPIWLSINVPADAKPGTYTGELKAIAKSGQSVSFNLELEVLPLLLPKPDQWSFHLDLWQHPWAVARVHALEPWSPAHWEKMAAVLKLAADAGQKCLTVSLINRPWGQQTLDAFGPMVNPTRHSDGSWSYNYSLFDRYVEFGMQCGITSQINCYSMVPWNNEFFFHDETSGEYTSIIAKPGTPEYADFWKPFLKSFSAHLKEKGWFDITTIAMDERPLRALKEVIKLVDEVDPEFKIALAADHNLTDIIDRVQDYSYAFEFDANRELNRARSNDNKKSTFYVCCNPVRPNTFTFSPPAESTWLAWNAAAEGYDGILRWALCSYTEDPFMSTDYLRKDWLSGDCFLIYPGARSSVRFERLREGIQDFEKIRIVREIFADQGDAGKESLKKLDNLLDKLVNIDKKTAKDFTTPLNEAKASFAELVRDALPE